jgi:hypothetical protein
MKRGIVNFVAATWMLVVVGTAFFGLVFAIVNLVMGNFIYPYF